MLWRDAVARENGWEPRRCPGVTQTSSMLWRDTAPSSREFGWEGRRFPAPALPAFFRGGATGSGLPPGDRAVRLEAAYLEMLASQKRYERAVHDAARREAAARMYGLPYRSLAGPRTRGHMDRQMARMSTDSDSDSLDVQLSRRVGWGSGRHGTMASLPAALARWSRLHLPPH